MTANGDLGAEGLDKLLTDTRQLIESMRSQPAEDAEPVEVTGSALDGAVQCTVTAPGVLTALDLGARAVRLPPAELSGHVMEAVNGALTELRTQTLAAISPVSPAELSAHVAELQDESIRQMAHFTSAISGAIAAIRRQG